MLHFIREKATGWIAYVIVGLLIIPFALWGINEYFDNGGTLVAANVNGTEISQREFQQAFYEQRSRMQQMLAGQYDAQLFDPQIKQRVISELVDRELLLQNADDMGYRVSNQTVVATIQGIDAFRENGAFSTALYQQQVQAQGRSPASFERRVKRLLTSGQLPDGLASSVLITDAELNAAIKLEEQKRDFQYVVLKAENFKDESVASDEAINAYYEKHADRFMTTEKVRVEYVELSAAALQSDEEPSEDELREFYDSNAAQFKVDEERQASHILIQIPEDADEAAVTAAREKADKLYAQIKAGEDYALLAKNNSDDPGSAELGGDLGYFGRGMMEADFEEIVFSQKEGGVSEPVLTSFGFHIIKLTGIRAEESKSFANVREEILAQFKTDAAERLYFDLTEKLTNMAYEMPDTLSEVAETLELELKESPFFARRGGAGVFANPRVTALAYSDDVLKQGFNSEPIELGENHVMVLRLLEHQQAARRPLADVKKQVAQTLIQDRAMESAKTAGEKAVQQFSAGESADAVLKTLSSTWVSAGSITRKQTGNESNGKVNPAIIKQAFKLQHPTAVSQRYGGIALSSGDYAVIQLNKVTDGDPAAFDKAAKETLKRRLAGEQGSNVQARLIAGFKSGANIVVQSDDL